MPYSLPKEYGFFVVHCVGIEIQGYGKQQREWRVID